MADLNQDKLFSEPNEPRSFPVAAVSIATVAVIILAVMIVLMSRSHGAVNDPTKLQPLAAYAPSLVISGVEMSEAEIPSGGKQTYIDGHIANHGPATVTAIMTQEIFSNDLSMPPQLEMTPLFLISSREPYIDTEPVSAAPMAPGGEADFRLIFENINGNWNTQPPAIHLTGVSTR